MCDNVTILGESADSADLTCALLREDALPAARRDGAADITGSTGRVLHLSQALLILLVLL